MADPATVIETAPPGSTIKYTLRGPATDEEKKEVADDLFEQYPHLTFVVYSDGAVSQAEIITPVPTVEAGPNARGTDPNG